MELSENETIDNYAIECEHCKRETLLPYEYEWTCLACSYIVIKKKNELTAIQRKNINFINRLKYTQRNLFCIWIGVYIFHQDNDNEKVFEVLSKWKNRKVKINNILIEKYKIRLENPNFEQNYYSKTAKGICKFGHDSIRLLKWMAHGESSYYEKLNQFDLMVSVFKNLNEISERWKLCWSKR